MEKAQIMDEMDMRRATIRLSREIIERNKGSEDLVLIGIQRRGVPIAKRLQKLILEHEGVEPPVGILDITLYRDDLFMLAEHPIINGTDIPFSIENKKVVIVDDVIFTGRTARAALDALMEFGRPKLIQLLVLVDRGHRELPIRADYVGKNIPTSLSEIVNVMVEEIDAADAVTINHKV